MGCIKKIIQHHQLINPLKTFLSRTASPNHELIVPITRNRSKVDFSIEPNLSIMFDSENFDGIHVIGFLSKNTDLITSGSCDFSVYQVSNDGLWTETLITSIAGIKDGNTFKVSIPSIIFGSVDLDGEFTLAITATITRLGINYKKKIYVNHIGIYDNLFRLRQDVEFLDITKVDE